ncbi:hypothetical protein KIL84_008296 [Mauremys mutica]|uniref:Uncharacterized protein n=1 Tax=Mauremys mutica TaxID=74926 RepID=A0A9D4ATA3_9SAUR|nr:hypothetical protein KIL84_008296 [Mauremys mutica]
MQSWKCDLFAQGGGWKGCWLGSTSVISVMTAISSTEARGHLQTPIKGTRTMKFPSKSSTLGDVFYSTCAHKNIDREIGSRTGLEADAELPYPARLQTLGHSSLVLPSRGDPARERVIPSEAGKSPCPGPPPAQYGDQGLRWPLALWVGRDQELNELSPCAPSSGQQDRGVSAALSHAQR